MAMSKEIGGGAARGVSIGGGHLKRVPAQSDSARSTKNWWENKKVTDAKSGKTAQENAKLVTKANQRNTGGITGKGKKNVVKIYQQMDE